MPANAAEQRTAPPEAVTELSLIESRKALFDQEKADLALIFAAIRDVKSEKLAKSILWGLIEQRQWAFFITYTQRLTLSIEGQINAIYSGQARYHWSEFFKEQGLNDILPSIDISISSLTELQDFSKESALAIINELHIRYTPEMVVASYEDAFYGDNRENVILNPPHQCGVGKDVIMTRHDQDLGQIVLNVYRYRSSLPSIRNFSRLNAFKDMIKGLIALNDPDWIQKLKFNERIFSLENLGIELKRFTPERIMIVMTEERARQLNYLLREDLLKLPV